MTPSEFVNGAPRRALLCGLVLAALGVAIALGVLGSPGGRAQASTTAPTLQYTNPMRDGLTGQPLSCPDPSVIDARQGQWSYFLFCTSDAAVNAFPIWKSEDLVHWYPDGYVFPAGKQPWWAQPATGSTAAGRYWAPAIYRIDNRWVLYFAARYDVSSGAAGSAELGPHTMVLGAATSESLEGPWHTTLLHYPGELNAQNVPEAQERVGGDIDPAVVRDPRTGQLYIFWAEQEKQIWESTLSSDGLTLGPRIQVAFTVSKPWECAAVCVVEGPQPFYHDGKIYVLYSGASTWNASYAVGVASSTQAMSPANPFVKFPTPVLGSAPGFLGPGGVSGPVTGPGGRSLILYHTLLEEDTHHISADRFLNMGSVNWVDGWPLIGDGKAGDSAASP